ncbi:MAG: hypothetical protein SFY80_05780 [Verrucomicrobiota bacterium]|nr:hypothetical protein [Verrucomicrobiota bacterium]
MANSTSRHNVQKATLRGSLILSLIAALPALSYAETKAATEEVKPNFITFTVGGSAVDGNKSTFQSRQQMKDGLYGGIESLHFETPMGEGMEFTLDGRSIFDNKDYQIQLGLKKKDLFTFKVGFEQYRKWYDGASQEFPFNGRYFVPRLDTYAVDRSKFVADFTLEIPDLPKLQVKYTHAERSGTKPSTINADTNLTAKADGTQVFNNSPVTNNMAARYFVPTDYGLDETRDTIELKGTYEIESSKTGLEAGVVVDRSKINNSFYFNRRPFEAASRKVTQKYNNTNDLFAAHGTVEQRLGDGLRLTTSSMWTTLDGKLSGSRIYGQTYDPVFDANYQGVQNRDHGFFNQIGTTRLEQFVGTFNLLYNPIKSVAIVPAIRFERTWKKGFDSLIDTNAGGTPLKVTQAPYSYTSGQDYSSVTGSLDTRYNGIKDWLFYAEGLYTAGEGNIRDDSTPRATGQTGPNVEEVEVTTIKLVAGVNWQVINSLKLAVQGYHKFNRNVYVDAVKTEYRVNDINARATWRILPNLTSISRFDYQQTAHFNKEYPNGANFNSTNHDRYIFSQSISFQPINRLALQGTVNYSKDKMEAIVDGELFTIAKVNPADGKTVTTGKVDANGAPVLDPKTGKQVQVPVLVTEPMARIYAPEMNYWTLSGTAVYAVSDDTDLSMTYSAYISDNYHDNSIVSLPLGNNQEEQSLVTTITKSFTPNLILTLEYGIYGYRDQMTGGHTDYLAHVVSSKLQYRF